MTNSHDETKPTTLEQWAGATRGRPKQLALLFTDIIGSTRLCSDMGDRSWIDVLIRHFEKARSLLRCASCYEVKIIGDSFMVVFETAVDALDFASGFLKDTGHGEVKIRAGIHVGAARVIENDIYGGMVNYTARVLKWHKEEGIGLSDSAREQIENELGRREARQMLTRVTYKFDDFDEPKVLWRVNMDDRWKHRIRQEFPRLAELSRAGEQSLGYRVEPATPEDIAWFAEIEAEAYEEDSVPLDSLRAWYGKNPRGFFTVKTREGERVGHIDILPVREESFRPLLEGRIKERELKPDALYAPAERDEVRDLYVESIIICLPDEQRTAAIYAVLSELKLMIGKLCNPAKARNVYAIAATPEGERFMRPLGFEQAVAAADRLDHHPFFCARYEDLIANIEIILGG